MMHILPLIRFTSCTLFHSLAHTLIHVHTHTFISTRTHTQTETREVHVHRLTDVAPATFLPTEILLHQLLPSHFFHAISFDCFTKLRFTYPS